MLQRLERVEREVKRLEGVERENAVLKQRLNRIEARRTPAAVAPASGAAAAADPAAANAAYIPPPTKAGVAYVRVCSMHGEGFFYIPGTDACIKLGGYLRLQVAGGASGDGIVTGASTMASQGLIDRTRNNSVNYQARGVMSLDVRAPTPLGQLRGYFRAGAEIDTPFNGNTGVSGLSVNNTANVFWDRGYIQFAGFTAGRAVSFFDIFSVSNRYTYANLRTNGDTELNGAILFGYTHQLGGGWSASLSVEDPGSHWKVGVIDATQASFNLGSITPDNAFGNQSNTTNGFRVPDIIANMRVDQAWGYVGVSGVLHQVAGAYYGTGNNTNNGNPDTKYGWAVAFGGKLNVPGTSGDTFGLNVVYGQGAVGYALKGERWSILQNNESIGLGWAVDGVFDGTGATRTPIHLTTAWSINAAYEHVWNQQWRTSAYGGYSVVNYGGAATTIINSHLPGGAGTRPCGPAVGGAVFPPLGIVPGDVNKCSPDFSFVQVGSRTQYNPFPWLDIGVDLSYTRLFTAYKGQATNGVNPGLPAQTVLAIDDQNIFTAIGRAQLNFLP
ncbi:MAG TPA: porin [Xanthobacteraceae bacterium]|nr:porin [Xanthobacteraceae bacterium]